MWRPARFTQGALPPPAFADPARKQKLMATLPEVERLVAEEFRKQKLPGLAAGLVIDGELVWAKGYGVRDLASRGPVDADTVFRIASMTKSFTGVAVVQLRDAGKLRLDDPVARHVRRSSRPPRPSPPCARCRGRGLRAGPAKIPRRAGADTAATRKASRLALGMRRTPSLQRYEPLHSAYLLMLRHHAAPRSSGPRSPGPPGVDAQIVPSLRALLSARGLAPEACRLTVRGTDPEGLVVVDVESEGRSLSLRLRPGGYEVVRGFEASPPTP